MKRANDRMIAVAEQRARLRPHRPPLEDVGGVAGRRGVHHVASFPQHTNREGDPQLHVHNAIANRAQRADGADDKWRALHGQPLFKEKLGLGALGDRFLAQELEQLGWRTCGVADGNALEVGGISEEAADVYSSRARSCGTVLPGARGASTSATTGTLRASRPVWALKQRAALETRDTKDHNPPAAGQELATWARRSRSGEARGSCPRFTEASRDLRSGARAERDAERGGAGPGHPRGRRRGPAAERSVEPLAAGIRARPGAPLAAAGRGPGAVPRRPGRGGAVRAAPRA